MLQTSLPIAAAALLIAATMIPAPPQTRFALFAVLLAVAISGVVTGFAG
jgi:hypothetical protein